MKWKRGQDWPNNGPEFMVAEHLGVRYTIYRTGNADSPWYALYANGLYLKGNHVMRKLKHFALMTQAS